MSVKSKKVLILVIHATPYFGKIFLTGFSANIFRYRDVKI